jgi:arylsulfatase A-like enzyme
MSRPNVLLVVSDQERQRDWLPRGLALPERQRLLDAGLEFTQYYTHTSPCSPSRGTLLTGQYLPVHGVNENCTQPANGKLDEGAQTLGKLFRDAGYYTAYKGKWHLSYDAVPNMDAYGWSDWEGNDCAFWGQAGTGVEFDEPIARSAADWIRAHADLSQPWFLTVALVNPHDIMWFPIDQPWYQERHPRHSGLIRQAVANLDWGREDPLPAFGLPYEEWFSELPPNFEDDLHTKPDVHRRFATEHARMCGRLDHDDKALWLRMLDYYAKLHQLSDQSLGLILAALGDVGGWDDTVVIYTSDHGEQCGAHGLRSKGPWNYQETLRVPLYVVAPGLTRPGTHSGARFSHVDLAATLGALGGVDGSGLPGRSMLPVLEAPETPGRDTLLFAQDWAWYDGLLETRYASRGIFDGRFKYCRYYGIGGTSTVSGRVVTESKRIGPDAPFEDQEHELYDLREDPHELVNLAMDRGRRAELREWFGRLRTAEHAEFGPDAEFRS